MKKALIAAAALVAIPFASANQMAKYDSTFNVSVEGLYAWAGTDDKADIGGGLLSFSSYTYSGPIYSQFSLTTGYMGGSDNMGRDYFGIDANKKAEMRAIPILVGYTANIPLNDTILFYVGAKIGAVSVKDETTYTAEGLFDTHKTTGWKFAYSLGAGIKIALSNTTDLKIGYEQYRMHYNSHSNPYHAIQAGICWSF